MHGTNCFRLPGTAKSRISPKAKNGKHRRQSPKSQKLSKNGSWAGRISLLTLRGGCSASSIMWPSCLPWNPVSYQGNTLRFLETVPPCIPMPAHAGTTGFAPEGLRHFPDPDASWGWDSDLEKYYFGYTLFQLSCYNSELRTDIPLLLRFTSARRHDSVNFLVAFHELEKHMPAVSTSNMCLDSAMDNYPPTESLKTGEYGPSST